MDIIVPVPPGDSKRPYNQAALLAKYVSTNTGIHYKDILYKKEEFPPQHSVNSNSKENNIKGKIGCNEKIVGLKVLLIDDTYITGDTKNPYRHDSLGLYKNAIKQYLNNLPAPK